MNRGGLEPGPEPNGMPWKSVSALATVFAFMSAAVWVWMRQDEKNCDWECFNFPAFILLVGLAGFFLICVLILVGMLCVWLWRGRRRVDDGTVGE